MLKRLFQSIKEKSYSLRFSILSVILILLIISMASLMELMYRQAMKNITYFAFNLMKQVSTDAFLNIDSELEKIEIKNKSVAKVIMSGVIDLNGLDNDEMLKFTIHILQNEGSLFPILQSVLWTDTKGNYVSSEKQEVGTVRSEVMYHLNNQLHHYYLYRNPITEKFTKVEASETHYDTTSRPWYAETIKNKATTWVDVYKSQLTNDLVVSVVSPVFSSDEKIMGLVKFDIRLDFLRHLIESIRFSDNGIVFIATGSGDLIAFPGLVQYKKDSVITVRELKNHPWIIEAYQNYLKTRQTTLTFEYDNKVYLASFNAFVKIGHHEWIVGVVAPRDDFIFNLQRSARMMLVLGLVILILSILVVSSIISRVVRPMYTITNEIYKIRNFELSNTPKVESRIKEINLIAAALYAMKQGLRSFQKYVPSSVVRDLVEAGEEAKMGGVKKPLAIFFTDIYNFTSIAETSDPDVLANRICEYLDVLSSVIMQQHGTIDKYIGDAVMAFWGAPLTVLNPCQKAAKAALHSIERLTHLNNLWAGKNIPAFLTSIGIHYGEATVGNFGSFERLNYTALGDAVNLASRLQSLNRHYGTNIIVSETVYAEIKNDFILRMIDRVTVKGKAEAVSIYELIGEYDSEANYDVKAYNAEFKKGFAAYKQCAWSEAITHFLACQNIYKEDRIAPMFISRCEKFKIDPPAKNWQGVTNLTQKFD